MGVERKHIVVIGAGVIGLQTAVSLLEVGFQVTIVAKHFPGDKSIEYTSPWAGAHWRSHASGADTEQCSWDIETYDHWLEMIRNEEKNPAAAKSGLGISTSTYYSNEASPPWFAEKVLSVDDLGTRTINDKLLHGHSYQSIMINVPMYLQYLNDTAVSLGATTIRTALPRSTSLAGTLRYAADVVRASSLPNIRIAAFVNATGISAKYLVPDENVYPVRGQTVTVKGQAKGITTVESGPAENATPDSPSITYILPRPRSGTTILGGTKQVGDSSGVINERTTEEILRRAKQFAPELLDKKGDFEVLTVQVGLRPGRKGGARVEVEEVRLPGGLGESMVVCHAYGHSGAGFQNSVGSARKVVGLLERYFENTGERARL